MVGLLSLTPEGVPTAGGRFKVAQPIEELFSFISFCQNIYVVF